METDGDLTLTCRQCGQPFVFTMAEQEFYRQKNFLQPQRCKQCRSVRNIPRPPLICLKCGTDIGEGGPTYCETCFENVQLEFELKARGLQKKIDEARAELKALEVEKKVMETEAGAKLEALELEKSRFTAEAEAKISTAENEKAQLLGALESRLKDVEYEKVQLVGQLEQKERAMAETQEQLEKVNIEFEKALRYNTALDWLEPVLKNVRQEMEILKLNQDNLHQAVLQLTSRIGENQNNGGWLKAFLRFFQPNRNSPASGCR